MMNFIAVGHDCWLLEGRYGWFQAAELHISQGPPGADT